LHFKKVTHWVTFLLLAVSVLVTVLIAASVLILVVILVLIAVLITVAVLIVHGNASFFVHFCGSPRL